MDILQELENLHWDLEREINNIDNHGWSKRMTRYDNEFIGRLTKRLQDYSNQIYNTREALKGE